MKNCDEMVNNLLERRDRYELEKKRKEKFLKRTVISVCCVCLVTLLGFSIWQDNGLAEVILDDSVVIGEKDYISPDESDVTISHDNSVETEEQTEVEETEITNNNVTNISEENVTKKENDICDIMGMVIIDDVTYLQFFSKEKTYTPNVCLGLVHNFEGTYKTHLTDVSGKLYTTKENEDVLIVELENGGVVTLAAKPVE